jgi:murein DD-endopeptidase MepM/ murein hydrolase activator NlpD
MWQMQITKTRLALLIFIALITLGFVLPEARKIPVAGASVKDWNTRSFWFEPWGRSGVHKGIDIFGPLGADILSTNMGIVLFAGELERGGKVVLVLSPKWRLHYFAHLAEIDTGIGHLVRAGEKIGTLGDTGNARGKPPHLHYSIIRIFPAPWAMDDSTQGSKKAFFIDPHTYLMENCE